MSQISYVDGLRSLSSFYTTSSLNEIVYENNLAIIKKKYAKYKDLIFGDIKPRDLNDFISSLYKKMESEYRNEYIFKNALINKILLGKYSLNTTTLLNEFRIGKSIADTILINGEAKLFEIKTDLDNLDRLDSQLEDYKKAVGKIYVVTNSKFIAQMKERYAIANIGLVEFTNTNTLKVHKEAEDDKSFFEHSIIFKMLRKSEYLAIIKHKFDTIPDVPNTRIYKECLNKVHEIDIAEFQKLAFCELKKRMINQPAYLKSKRTPYELKYLCYTMNLDEEKYEHLYKILNRGI